MRFNKNGQLAKFYLWFEQDKDEARLPDDFCTYFWGLVGRCIASAVFAAILAGVVVGAGYIIYSACSAAWRNRTTVGMVLVPMLIMTLFLLWDHHRKGKKVEFVKEIKAVINGKVDAVKNRYCPRIEWME